MKKPTLSLLQFQLQEVQKAYASFYDAIREYDINASDYVRDSVLQRFEYCIEWSRKLGRNILLYELVDADLLLSAGQCLKQMHVYKMIDDIGLWIDLVDARNALSHVYSEDKSLEIFHFVKKNSRVFGQIENTFIRQVQSYHD